MSWRETGIVFVVTATVAVTVAALVTLSLTRELDVVLAFAAIVSSMTVLPSIVLFLIVLKVSSQPVAITTYAVSFVLVLLWLIYGGLTAPEIPGIFWDAMRITVPSSVAALATLTLMTRPLKPVIREAKDSRDQS